MSTEGRLGDGSSADRFHGDRGRHSPHAGPPFDMMFPDWYQERRTSNEHHTTPMPSQVWPHHNHPPSTTNSGSGGGGGGGSGNIPPGGPPYHPPPWYASATPSHMPEEAAGMRAPAATTTDVASPTPQPCRRHAISSVAQTAAALAGGLLRPPPDERAAAAGCAADYYMRALLPSQPRLPVVLASASAVGVSRLVPDPVVVVVVPLSLGRHAGEEEDDKGIGSFVGGPNSSGRHPSAFGPPLRDAEGPSGSAATYGFGAVGDHIPGPRNAQRSTMDPQ